MSRKTKSVSLKISQRWWRIGAWCESKHRDSDLALSKAKEEHGRAGIDDLSIC